jgi:hypothetical protein
MQQRPLRVRQSGAREQRLDALQRQTQLHERRNVVAFAEHVTRTVGCPAVGVALDLADHPR